MTSRALATCFEILAGSKIIALHILFFNLITLIIIIFLDYFDITAKSCYASGITLLEDRCPVDDYLFGQFNSTGHGYLHLTFDMFRPTNIAGGPTEVVFTCIIEVCLWNCPEVGVVYFLTLFYF